jgi:hypothetical protein
MVSDNRPGVRYRECPSIPGRQTERPLFQQCVTEGTCQRRQDRGYHKCHQCEFQELARVRREVQRIPMF